MRRLRARGRAGLPVDARDYSTELLHALTYLREALIIGCKIGSMQQICTWPVPCSGFVLVQVVTLLEEGAAVCRS